MRLRKILSLISQSTTEYAVLLAIVAASLVAMQVYLKRGIQGRIRDLADQISQQQYEQGRTDSSYTTTQSGTTVQQYINGTTEVSQEEEVSREGYEKVTPETY